MSIIYKSLKKLQSNSIGAEKQGTRFKQNRQSRSDRNIFKIPVLICLLTVFVILVGFGLVYGVYSFNKTSDEVEAYDNTTLRATDSALNLNGENGEDNLIVDSNSTEGEYSPPELEIIDSDEENEGHISVSKKVKAETKGSITIRKEKSEGYEVSNIPKPYDPVRTEYNLKQNTFSNSRIGKKNENRNGSREIQQQNRDRSYKIIRLVKQIQESIKEGKKVETERLLIKLEKLKGKSDSYVLKLRSYLYMQQGENQTASNMLKKVIRMNAKDLEAGINMAIIEIRTERFQEAAKRLKDLKRIYPENSLIKELIKKVQSSMNTFESTLHGVMR